MEEPMISVGVMVVEGALDFRLVSPFEANRSVRFSPGEYKARLEGNRISVLDKTGGIRIADCSVDLLPVVRAENRFVLRNVPIGAGFHWEHLQDLLFQGDLQIRSFHETQLQVINRLPLETYLSSVLNSEIRGTAPIEFLKAHAVIARSWALRKIQNRSGPAPSGLAPVERTEEETILRWSDAENHQGFDVCADDHCQRYRGVVGGSTSSPERAVQETRGVVLSHGDETCDTRYCKCCGGMTENFAAAWEDRDIPYLRALPDADAYPPGFSFPLSEEKNASAWITGFPEAFCNTSDRELLEAVLPESDRGTKDFFRWHRMYSQEELAKIVGRKTGRDLGMICDLVPLERGASGRIIRLRIVGTDGTLTVGKELEIRRVLSPTHLYSSAFVVEREPGKKDIPRCFRLIGAGWGHGVGLCQIGAAVMASRGNSYREIICHYFPETSLKRSYGGGKFVENGSAIC
jgi:SpoIID/LytB domain protein